MHKIELDLTPGDTLEVHITIRVRQTPRAAPAGRPRPKTETALTIIRQHLTNGPRPSAEVRTTLLAAGIGRTTIERALHQLGVIIEREPRYQGTTTWRLPTTTATNYLHQPPAGGCS